MRITLCLLFILGACKPQQVPKTMPLKPAEVLFRTGGLDGAVYKASLRVINPNAKDLAKQKIYLRYFDKTHTTFIKQDSVVVNVPAKKYKIVSFETQNCAGCEWLDIVLEAN